MNSERLASLRRLTEHCAYHDDGNDVVACTCAEPLGARPLITELLGYVDALTAERDMLKRGGKTLGEIVDRQCSAVIEATGSQDIIGEDGDGDWEIVWERLHLMRAALADMTRQRDDARRIAIDSGYFQDHKGEDYDLSQRSPDDTTVTIGPVAWDVQEQQR